MRRWSVWFRFRFLAVPVGCIIRTEIRVFELGDTTLVPLSLSLTINNTHSEALTDWGVSVRLRSLHSTRNRYMVIHILHTIFARARHDERGYT